jgi:hypothetical protein
MLRVKTRGSGHTPTCGRKPQVPSSLIMVLQSPGGGEYRQIVETRSFALGQNQRKAARGCEHVTFGAGQCVARARALGPLSASSGQPTGRRNGPGCATPRPVRHGILAATAGDSVIRTGHFACFVPAAWLWNGACFSRGWTHLPCQRARVCVPQVARSRSS